MPYKFVEGITVADMAFEATGRTPEKMFEAAALALTNIQVKSLKAIKPIIRKAISVNAEDLERLLFTFLQELIFLKDVDQLVFSKYKVEIFEKDKKFMLNCVAQGEKLNMKKHNLIVDAKAITYHQFEVKKTKKGWRAVVVVDI